MTFQIIESLCVRGSAVMEDRMGWGENYLFVIDGASGLTASHITSAGSDSAWLAETLGQKFHQLLPQTALSLPEILERAAGDLKSEYDTCWDRPAPPDYPSAGVALLRLREDTLEYLGLGDCSAAVELSGHTVETLEETRLPALDREALEQMARLCQETGCTMAEARERCNDVLIRNRDLRNHPEGYWIFDPSGAGIPYARQKSWPAPQVRSVSLMSDGFTQLIEPFGLAGDLPDLFHKMKEQGLADLAATLFSRQQADPDCLHHPRFKLRDDTTALWATVE